jgi:hypothetical protein
MTAANSAAAAVNFTPSTGGCDHLAAGNDNLDIAMVAALPQTHWQHAGSLVEKILLAIQRVPCAELNSTGYVNKWFPRPIAASAC